MSPMESSFFKYFLTNVSYSSLLSSLFFVHIFLLVWRESYENKDSIGSLKDIEQKFEKNENRDSIGSHKDTESKLENDETTKEKNEIINSEINCILYENNKIFYNQEEKLYMSDYFSLDNTCLLTTLSSKISKMKI